jgi:hypothetical protein
MLRRTSMLQAPGDRCAKPTGYQAHAEIQLQGEYVKESFAILDSIWVFCQNKVCWSDSSCKHIQLPRGPDIQVCRLQIPNKSTGIIPFASTFGCHEGPTFKYADSKIPTDRTWGAHQMIPTSQPEFWSNKHDITYIGLHMHQV